MSRYNLYFSTGIIAIVTAVFTYLFCVIIFSDTFKLTNINLNTNNNGNVYYVKDVKSNLCFVAHYLGYNEELFINVPCTAEINNKLTVIK